MDQHAEAERILWAFLVQKQLFYTRGMDALVFLCGHGRLRGHSASLCCVAAPHADLRSSQGCLFAPTSVKPSFSLECASSEDQGFPSGQKSLVGWQSIGVTKCGHERGQHSSNEDQHCLSSLITSEAGVRGYRPFSFYPGYWIIDAKYCFLFLPPAWLTPFLTTVSCQFHTWCSWKVSATESQLSLSSGKPPTQRGLSICICWAKEGSVCCDFSDISPPRDCPSLGRHQPLSTDATGLWPAAPGLCQGAQFGPLLLTSSFCSLHSTAGAQHFKALLRYKH